MVVPLGTRGTEWGNGENKRKKNNRKILADDVGDVGDVIVPYGAQHQKIDCG